jgi:hypothetical protein
MSTLINSCVDPLTKSIFFILFNAIYFFNVKRNYCDNYQWTTETREIFTQITGQRQRKPENK